MTATQLLLFSDAANDPLWSGKRQPPVLKPTFHARPLEPINTPTVAVLAQRLLIREQARVQRQEIVRGSLQVLQNRLKRFVLPLLGHLPVQHVNYLNLEDFANQLSSQLSAGTVHQYLVLMRKILLLAQHEGHLTQLPDMPKIKVRSQPRSAFTPSEYWVLLRCARALKGQAHPQTATYLRQHHKIRHADMNMPPDVAWVIGFMVNSFVRPSDLKTLKHRHVEIVQHLNHRYLRLTLPETKRHASPIVTLQPAVRIYEQIQKARPHACLANDYVFLPHLTDREYALAVLGVHMNWVLSQTELKTSPHGTKRSLYSLRHSAITFRLLYGNGIDLLTLARNARTSIDMIHKHYASTVTAEQNIAMLQSRRSR